MAKLSQLLILEGMFATYDNMSVQDACVVRYQGMCIEGVVDDIIVMLKFSTLSAPPFTLAMVG